jgi:hypothetical protein
MNESLNRFGNREEYKTLEIRQVLAQEILREVEEDEDGSEEEENESV